MKVVVFGATGGTSRQIVTQALGAGHEVTVIAWNPEAVDIRFERLRIFQGDVLGLASFRKWIVDQNAVLSALGVNHCKAKTVYFEGAENIERAMQEANVRRLVCWSSAGLVIHRGWYGKQLNL